MQDLIPKDLAIEQGFAESLPGPGQEGQIVPSLLWFKDLSCKYLGGLLLASAGIGKDFVHSDDLAVEGAGNQRIALDFAGLRIGNRDMVHL